MIELVQYRDLWLREKMGEVIGFYTREFYCLDNFSPFKIFFDDVLYSTVEEAYQALKFIETAPEVFSEIRNCRSAYDAKMIAQQNIAKQRPDWDEVKLDIMERLLREKIKQHPYVLKKLLATKDCLIVEDSPYDTFWGWGKERNGENHLGKLWMKLREEYRNNPLA